MKRTLPSKRRGRRNRKNRTAILALTISSMTALSFLTITSMAQDVNAKDYECVEVISVEATVFNALPEEVVPVAVVQNEPVLQKRVIPVVTQPIEEQIEEETIATEVVEEANDYTVEWQGEVLTASKGVNNGPSGKETYYNLDMTGVIAIMKDLGYDYEYSVREDGVKLYGGYVMCAANLELRPKGTIVDTSLGKGIVCDTGTFAYHNPTQLDIAVTW